MVTCGEIVDTVFLYTTPKLVNIHSIAVGVISRLIQLLIISYIIGYVIVYKKGYQDFSAVQSSVTTKVKGVAYTNFSDEDFNPGVEHKDLYRRIWDVADYVVPPSENGATFVTTNIIITPNQTQSTCPEDPSVLGAACHPEHNTCVAGKPLQLGNGVMTGNCVKAKSDTNDTKYSCEIHAWCPVENDIPPLKNKTALLSASQDFTILLKNFVTFPKFKNSNRRNIKDTANKTYLESCLYDIEKDPECPVFRLGDIVRWANQDFNSVASKVSSYYDLAYKGGVIAIVINWDCNLDFNKKYCFPTYSFERLDDPAAKLAPGWNFRHASYYGDNTRTLYKAYGIKFTIIVQGQAGKFMIVPLLLNVGAGLGLLAIEAVVCDILILYLTKKKALYKSKKYENVDVDEIDDFLVAPAEWSHNSTLTDDAGDGYKTFGDK